MPLEMRAVLVQVKADWEALCNLIGFQSWGSFFRPCLLCSLTKDMLDELSGISLDEVPWDCNRPGDYEACCRACEIVITVRTPEERRHILIGG